MVFQPAPNTIEVNCRCTLLGERVENTLYFEVAGTPTLADVTGITNMVDLWFTGDLLPLLSSAVVITEIYGRSLAAASAPEFIDTSNAGADGGQAAAPMPGNVSWAVKFTTGLTGRSYRGRNFIFGLTEAQVTGNQLDGSQADLIVAAYENLIADAIAADATWVVLSRIQGGVVLANAIGAPIIGVGYTDLNVDSQRRRLAGRGS